MYVCALLCACDETCDLIDQSFLSMVQYNAIIGPSIVVGIFTKNVSVHGHVS